MKRILYLAMVPFLANGCSTTYTVVEPSSRNPYTKTQFTDNIASNELVVEFRDGSVVETWGFLVGAESCRWIDPKTRLSREARTKEIKRVVEINHPVGGLEGLGIGLVGGTVAGVVFGGLSGDPLLRVIFGVGGAIVGSAVGTIWGASSGHTDRYEFVWFSKPSPGKEEQHEEKR